jgi:hypothetical protein
LIAHTAIYSTSPVDGPTLKAQVDTTASANIAYVADGGNKVRLEKDWTRMTQMGA